MSLSKQERVNYLFNQARAAQLQARLYQDCGDNCGAVIRVYWGMYYAASAALIINDEERILNEYLDADVVEKFNSVFGEMQQFKNLPEWLEQMYQLWLETENENMEKNFTSEDVSEMINRSGKMIETISNYFRDNHNLQVAKQMVEGLTGFIVSAEGPQSELDRDFVTILGCPRNKKHPVVVAIITSKNVFYWNKRNHSIIVDDITITPDMMKGTTIIENGPSYKILSWLCREDYLTTKGILLNDTIEELKQHLYDLTCYWDRQV